MNVTAYSADAYGAPSASRSLTDLRATGTNHVALVPSWYMASITSSTVAPDRLQTPTDASLLQAMSTARGLGLNVVLKSQVDVRDGAFRGDIRPASVEAWFASSAAMVDHYADLATQGGAQTLVVGDELTSMASDTTRFEALIAGVRRRFHGRLTFAANWVQGAEQVHFWPALDVIGVDAYMPLTPGHLDPSTAALQQAWKPWVRRLAALSSRYRQPVLFTELGYTSRQGTASAPATEGSGAVDQISQARAYEAAYRTFASIGWFAGIYGWDWSADGHNGATADGSYRPGGKLAEASIRYWSGAPLSPAALALLRSVSAAAP